jgi:hypothetical protein
MLRKIRSAVCLAVLAGVLAAPAGAQPPPQENAPGAPSPAELVAALERLTAVVEAQRRELAAQRELLERQRELLERIERRMDAAAPAGATLVSAAAPASAADFSAVPQQHAGHSQPDSAAPAAAGPLRFSGDLRVRYEPFFQPGSADRHRFRIRARLNGEAELSSELRAGFTLATGRLTDVNSTNQSFTDFFTRKPVGFDRYWMSYRPAAAKGLELVGGKFAPPWQSTALTFDADVNVEGFAQSFTRTGDGALESFSVVGFQLPLRESAGERDSYLAGAQAGARFRVGQRGRIGIHAAGLNFVRADALARALGTVITPALANTNRLTRDDDGNVTGFASRFLLVDLLGQAEYRFSPRWPLALDFNFVRNTRALDGESDGYWTELALGRAAEPGEFRFSYMFTRIERDAVLSAFNESDLRAGTNVLNHRVMFRYRATPRVTLDYSLMVGRLARPELTPELVPEPRRAGCLLVPAVDCRDPYLKRMQLDAVYRF